MVQWGVTFCCFHRQALAFCSKLLLRTKMIVDEGYLKDAILHPGKDDVKGYPDIMPPQGNNVSEEELLEIIRYLKGLK